MFTVCWTEDVLAEAIYHLRKANPRWDGGVFSDLREKIAGTFQGGRIDSYPVDAGYPGPDEHDQHLHAAALAGGVDIVLTQDSSFLPPEHRDSVPYEVYNADEFFVLVDDSGPDRVLEATICQIAYYRRHSGRVDLAERLQNANCPAFAERVRTHVRHCRQQQEEDPLLVALMDGNEAPE